MRLIQSYTRLSAILQLLSNSLLNMRHIRHWHVLDTGDDTGGTETRAIFHGRLPTGACSSATTPAARDRVECRTTELTTTDEVHQEIDGVVGVIHECDDAEK